MAALLSLLGILLSGQGGLMVHALFQARQAHIAAHLCENRFDPGSKCNGMCFLKKRVAEHEQQHRDHTATVTVSPVLFFLPAAEDVALCCGEARYDYGLHEAGHVLDGHRRAVDRPPRVG